MASAGGSQARWIAIVLGVAIVASALITYTLVELTSPRSRNPVPTTAIALSGLASSSEQITTDPGPPPSTSSDRAPAAPSQTLTTPEPTFPDESTGPFPSASDGTSPGSSSAPPTTQTSALPGSKVIIPAAWSGVAKVTVEVLGECATSTPSVYTGVEANLALDLTQNEMVSNATTVSTPVRNSVPTLTLGVGTDSLPKLAVFTSVVGEAGQFQRYWDLSLTADDSLTAISGTMRNVDSDGTNPNFLADSETSLQPCESAGTVAVPRVLGRGSTLHGWVSANHAELMLVATTTDGKRAVTVEFSADRKQ